MKTMVVSCLEPQHLRNCLKALKMWLPADEIYVINNANNEERKKEIFAIANEGHVNVIRPEYVEEQKNTKPFIHRITNDFAKRFPNEIILKVDEDNILISTQDKFQFEKGVFFFPTSTINNYTTRFFLMKFWPDLFEKLKGHTWMWHEPVPLELKNVLFDAIYKSDPANLIRFTESRHLREYITNDNCDELMLMSERGISTHAVAFHASDHIANYGCDADNQEKRFYALVKQGVMSYVVDHNIFCHHVNYHSVRDNVRNKPDLVNTFHERIFSYYASAVKTPRARRARRDVCVTTGWYSDHRGGVRGRHTLAPQLFEADFLTKVLIPRVQKQIKPKAYLIYVSQCEIPPDPMPEGPNIEIVRGRRVAARNTTPGKPPYAIGAAHDWGATYMSGAMYAYCNDLDFVFIEQDCLVHNFEAALQWAQGKKIVYGFGEKSSFGPGWAEPSFTYVSCEFLPEFMRRMCAGMWHQWNENFVRVKHPEIQFHNTFIDVAEPWPFGYGMLRPIDHNQDVYFAQRFNEPDYLAFLEHSPV